MSFFKLKNSIFMIAIVASAIAGVVNIANAKVEVTFSANDDKLSESESLAQQIKEPDRFGPDKDVAVFADEHGKKVCVKWMSAEKNQYIEAVVFFEDVNKRVKGGESWPEYLPACHGVVLYGDKVNHHARSWNEEGFRKLRDIRRDENHAAIEAKIAFNQDGAKAISVSIANALHEIHNTFKYTMGDSLSADNVLVNIETGEFKFTGFKDFKKLPEEEIEKQEVDSSELIKRAFARIESLSSEFSEENIVWKEGSLSPVHKDYLALYRVILRLAYLAK